MHKLVSCLTLHERLHLSLSNLFDWSRKYSSNVQLINILHLLEWFTGLLAIFNYFFSSSVKTKYDYPAQVSDKTLIARNVF